MADFPKYPKPVSTTSGCKVGWYKYDNLADATEASKAAAIEAVRMAGFGYDFGYCVPGEIRTAADGTYIVTVP